MDKSIKIMKVIERQTIYIGVGAGAEACGENPTEKGVIRRGKKLYRPPLPSTYKETKLLEDLNDGMEWFQILRDLLESSRGPPNT